MPWKFIRGLPMDRAIREFHEATSPGIDHGRYRELLAGLVREIRGDRHEPGGGDDFQDWAFRELLLRFRSICEAIAYAHSRGVIHRDLKPHNVMLGKFGESLVVDWGLAKPFGTTGDDEEVAGTSREPGAVDDDHLLTPTNGPKGTPSYMSPEQAEGRPDLGPASDIYSLGATLYAILAGQAPFTGRVGEVIRLVPRGQFKPPAAIKPATPRALQAICLKAMATDPAGRYATAEGLADDIDNWLADRPVSAHREPWTTRASRWARRHRTLVASVGTASVVDSVLAIGFVYATNARRDRADRSGESALAAASRLAAEAEVAPNEGRWARAVAEARRAEAVIESGGGSPAIRLRAASVADDYAARLADLRASTLRAGRDRVEGYETRGLGWYRIGRTRHGIRASWG